MTMSHFTALFVFAMLVSIVFALINKTRFRDQISLGRSFRHPV